MSETVRAAGIVVYRGRQKPEFLLLRNSRHGTWGFPKGRLKRGETDPEAAHRETLEETGIAGVDLDPGFRFDNEYQLPVRGELRRKQVVYFLGSVGPDTAARISPEHSELAWLRAPEAMERIAFENLRSVLAAAVCRIWKSAGPAAVKGASDPGPALAREILFSLGSTADPWVRHSLAVGEVAASIAAALENAGAGVDPGLLYSAGALHDVGRALDHEDHGRKGHEILSGLGLSMPARASIAHWLKGRTRSQTIEDGTADEELLDELESMGAFEPLSLELKVVCLADALTSGDRVVPLDERFDSAERTYGRTPWMKRNRENSRALQAEIEALTGRPLLPLLTL